MGSWESAKSFPGTTRSRCIIFNFPTKASFEIFGLALEFREQGLLASVVYLSLDDIYSAPFASSEEDNLRHLHPTKFRISLLLLINYSSGIRPSVVFT